MKDLESIIHYLNQNHIYPDTKTTNGKVIALEVDAAPILMNDRIEYLKKLLGEDYVITPFTSEGFIKVTLKK